MTVGDLVELKETQHLLNICMTPILKVTGSDPNALIDLLHCIMYTDTVYTMDGTLIYVHFV